MIEPPHPGFTGVVWEALEPDRMARELTTGPGALPLAEAGAAWAKLAAGLGGAVVEYEQIVATLRGAWQSSTSRDVLDRITSLRDWLTESATAAGDNALKAEKQAAAYELARLTMPNTMDIAAIQEIQRLLQLIGSMLGAPIHAVAAQTDTDSDAAKAAASRVMRSYEASTEPLALPWEHREPPVLAAPAALEAEQANTTLSASGSASARAVMPGMVAPVFHGLGAIPRAKTAYQAPVYAQTAAGETLQESVAPQPQPVPAHTASSMPMMPGAMAPGVSAQEEEYQPYAGVAEATDALGPELGMVAAPAVLGAPEPAAAPPVHATPTQQPATGGAA